MLRTGSGVQLPGEGQIPLAPTLVPNETFAIAFTVFCYAVVAATLVWAVWMASRRSEPLPLLLFFTGIIAANMEPIGDTVGLITYARDLPWFNYWVMGRSMPAFILVGSAAFICLGGYGAYKYLLTGRSTRAVILAASAVAVPEVISEMVIHRFGIIAYYGNNPSLVLGVPLYTIVQNIGVLVVLGWVILAAKRYLHGLQLAWLILAVPAVTIGYIVGATWPAYQALQSSAPASITWIAVLVSCVASAAAPYALLRTPLVTDLAHEKVSSTTIPAAPTHRRAPADATT